MRTDRERRPARRRCRHRLSDWSFCNLLRTNSVVGRREPASGQVRRWKSRKKLFWISCLIGWFSSVYLGGAGPANPPFSHRRPAAAPRNPEGKADRNRGMTGLRPRHALLIPLFGPLGRRFRPHGGDDFGAQAPGCGESPNQWRRRRPGRAQPESLFSAAAAQARSNSAPVRSGHFSLACSRYVFLGSLWGPAINVSNHSSHSAAA